jgi:hypothetical protein
MIRIYSKTFVFISFLMETNEDFGEFCDLIIVHLVFCIIKSKYFGLILSNVF